MSDDPRDIELLPGHFNVSSHGHYLFANCPCGCTRRMAIPLRAWDEPPTAQTSWQWDGNRQCPTLNPSIRRMTPCGFHGYLKTGKWISAGDGAPVASNCFEGQLTATQ